MTTCHDTPEQPECRYSQGGGRPKEEVVIIELNRYVKSILDMYG